MIKMRVSEKDLVNNMHAVCLLKLQQGRHNAHAHVDQCVPDDFLAVPLN